MALNHRLTIVGSDVNNNDVEIKLYLEAYAGEPVTREGSGNILEMQWGAEGKQLPLVYGAAAQVRFWAEDEFEFTDLFTSNSRDVYIEIYINTVLFWVGYIEPDKWDEPLITAPYEVGFTAYDGLGLLKDEDFLTDAKEIYTGEATQLEILQLILSKTGLNLPLLTAINYRPHDAATDADPLTQSKIDLEAYTELSCYDVLEQLFLNNRIQQRGAKWSIINNTLLAATSISCYKYTAAGEADGTTSINPRLTGFWLENEPAMQLVPAMKQVLIKQEYGYKNTLLENADFSKFDGEDFEGWTAVNVNPKQLVYDSDGNKFVYLKQQEYIRPWQGADFTKYIVSQGIRINAASDILNIKFGYALLNSGGSGGAAHMFWGLTLEGDNGTNYTVETSLGLTESFVPYVNFYFVESVHKYPIPVNYRVNRKNRASYVEFTAESNLIPGYSYEDIIKNFEELSISIEGGIPTAGVLKMYLFVPHTPVLGTYAACFREIQIFFTDEDAETFSTKTGIIIVNSLRNNYVPKDIELVNGDVPEIANAKTMYRGAFINVETEETTTLWNIDGDANQYPFIELMGRMMGAELRTIKQSYDARIADVIPGLNMVFEDTENNPGKLFVESGITYDFRLCAIEGRFVELITPLLPPFTLSATTEKDKGGNNSGTSKLNPTFNTDEKVALIDIPTKVIFGKPGYLSGDYFDQEIDENTGRAIISPKALQPDGLISGGVVTWLHDLTFAVSEAFYIIRGKLYNSPATIITLNDADDTDARIDVIAVNTDKEVIKITGVPSPFPQKPSHNAATQLELTFILVPAAATEPDGITGDIIYNENTEWTGAATGPSAVFDDTTEVYNGTVSADISSIEDADTITFTSAAPVNVADYETISMFINLKAELLGSQAILLRFTLDGDPISNEKELTINPGAVNAWQNIALQLSAFTFVSETFDGIIIRFNQTGEIVSHNGFYLDLIQLQKGIPQAPTNGTNGTDGREIELQENAGWVEWRYVGDSTWAQLYEITTGGGGADIVAGLGMDFTTNEAVDLGLPSTINGTTENALTETSHTHKLGNVPIDNVVSGSPVEYGALYNRYAATDTRKISSDDDWIVPTNDQCYTLMTALDPTGTAGINTAGGKLKETGIIHWNSPNTDATNETLFNGVGSGYRYDGEFYSFRGEGFFWTTSTFITDEGKSVGLISSGSIFYVSGDGVTVSFNYKTGLSLRLLYTGTGTPTEYIGNNGLRYPVKLMPDGKYWITCNLNETKYRNGDWITGFDGGVYTPIADAAWAALTTEAMCYYSDNEENGGGETPVTIPAAQIQSDWDQADTGALDYIKNKPTITANTDEKVKYDAADPTAGYLSEKIIAGTNITIEEGIGADENKLKINATGGGEENVQSDWNQTNSSADDYIKNKPTIPSAGIMYSIGKNNYLPTGNQYYDLNTKTIYDKFASGLVIWNLVDSSKNTVENGSFFFSLIATTPLTGNIMHIYNSSGTYITSIIPYLSGTYMQIRFTLVGIPANYQMYFTYGYT